MGRNELNQTNKQTTLKSDIHLHTGQSKCTGGCFNELVVANFRTGAGVKWRKG